MTESLPNQPEDEAKLVHPITELVPGIAEADAALLTRLAGFDQHVSAMSSDFAHHMPWAVDQAYMHPHHTAKLIREEAQMGPVVTDALRLGYEVQRSGIAYRVSANPNLTWMATLNDDAIRTVRQDKVFMARRTAYMFEPNAPWLYQRMQSRLLVCLAWMAEGKPMEGRKISSTVRERLASEASKLLMNEEDGI